MVFLIFFDIFKNIFGYVFLIFFDIF